jgi:hypothetical protein
MIYHFEASNDQGPGGIVSPPPPPKSPTQEPVLTPQEVDA